MSPFVQADCHKRKDKLGHVHLLSRQKDPLPRWDSGGLRVDGRMWQGELAKRCWIWLTFLREWVWDAAVSQRGMSEPKAPYKAPPCFPKCVCVSASTAWLRAGQTSGCCAVLQGSANARAASRWLSLKLFILPGAWTMTTSGAHYTGQPVLFWLHNRLHKAS